MLQTLYNAYSPKQSNGKQLTEVGGILAANIKTGCLTANMGCLLDLWAIPDQNIL